MADIHQWRRMIQPCRSRSQDLRGAQEQFTESGDVGSMSRTRRSSTEHMEVQSTRVRLRPKSRLASYLGTHRSSSSPDKPDGAVFSASSTNDKDEVYHPDPLQMSYTIQKRLLAFPAEGLPAQHNSLLMHLIEAFRDLSINRTELLEQLDEEKKSRAADLHQFQCNEQSWLEEREIHRLKIVNLESDLARIGRGRPSSTALMVGSPHVVPHAESSNILGITSKGTTSRQEETMEKDGKAPHYQWPSSPSRYMARLSKRLLTSDNDTELLPASLTTSAGQAPPLEKPVGIAVVGSSTAIELAAPVTRCVSDSEPSSVEGDLLPDEEALIVVPTAEIVKASSAIRLMRWLANRVGSDPEEIFSEISELLYGITMAVPDNLPRLGSDDAKQPLPRLPGPNTSSPATDVTQATVQRSTSEEGLLLRAKSPYQHGHSRGFSFLPGDDVEQPVVSSTKGTIRSMESPPPLMDVPARSRPVNQYTPSLDSSLSFAGSTLSPQRNASAESAKTAIRGSTSLSSSESIRSSCGTGLGPEGTDLRSKRLTDNPTAVAAARAASINGSTFRWQEQALHPTGPTGHECYQSSGVVLQRGRPYAGKPLLGNVYHSLGLKPEEEHK